MSDEILDVPFHKTPIPPKNANVLLFIALTFIITIPILFFFISILDKYAIRFTHNHIGEFIYYTASSEHLDNSINRANLEANLLKYFLQSTLRRGLISGVALGIILSTAFGFITQLRGEFSFAWKYIKHIIFIILGSWLLAAIGYQIAADLGIKEISLYPWLVGGEKGRYFGSFAGAFYFIGKIYFEWKKRMNKFYLE